MEEILIDILGYVFRKLGLFSRYIFYLLIGRRKTFKYLDRRQRDSVEFTQRGINAFIGFLIFLGLFIFLIKQCS